LTRVLQPAIVGQHGLKINDQAILWEWMTQAMIEKCPAVREGFQVKVIMAVTQSG